MTLDWINQPAQQPDHARESAAAQRQVQLTKPPGALGKLEALAIRLAGLQHRDTPAIEDVSICIFAGDHGVAAQGVSAFPQAVTTEMIKNFSHGGAAINVLAEQHQARLEVINLGTVGDTSGLTNIRSLNLGRATQDFTKSAAMTPEQLTGAVNAGRESVTHCDLYIGGEMGIGNTTSASALACALLNQPADQLVGPGTGLDSNGIALKTAVIQQGLTRHQSSFGDPLKTLRCLGGFEIAALVGAYIHCAQRGVTVLVDGFISSVAALIATRLQPDIAAWLIYAHQSAEPGHRRVLAALDADPLLDLGLRLGEGSGAAVAIPLLQQACTLHNRMATFSEAAVSNRE